MGVSIIGTSLWFTAVYMEGQSPWILGHEYLNQELLQPKYLIHPQSDLNYPVYENTD